MKHQTLYNDDHYCVIFHTIQSLPSAIKNLINKNLYSGRGMIHKSPIEFKNLSEAYDVIHAIINTFQIKESVKASQFKGAIKLFIGISNISSFENTNIKTTIFYNVKIYELIKYLSHRYQSKVAFYSIKYIRYFDNMVKLWDYFVDLDFPSQILIHPGEYESYDIIKYLKGSKFRTSNTSIELIQKYLSSQGSVMLPINIMFTDYRSFTLHFNNSTLGVND